MNQTESASSASYAAGFNSALQKAERRAALQQQLCAELNLAWTTLAPSLSKASEDVAATLTRLDFDLLKVPGWRVRILGLGRSAARKFIDEWHEVSAAESRLEASTRAFAQQHKARIASVEMTARDLEAESHRVAQSLSEASQYLASFSRALTREQNKDSRLPAFQARSAASLEEIRPLNTAALRVPGALRQVAKSGCMAIELLQKDWTPTFNRWRASMKVLEDRIDTVGYLDESPDWQCRMHKKLLQLMVDVKASCAQVEEQEVELGACLAKLAGNRVAPDAESTGTAEAVPLQVSRSTKSL